MTEQVIQGIFSILTTAIGAFLGVYFDRRWPRDSTKPDAPSDASSDASSDVSPNASPGTSPDVARERQEPAPNALPQADRPVSSDTIGKRNVYTINITSTVLFTIAGFYLMFDNFFGSEALFMLGVMLLFLDILLNVFVFNPRMTYKIPLICAATMAVVSVSMTFVEGPRSFSTEEIAGATHALFVVFAVYLFAASVALGLRRTIKRMPLF